jgi:cytochrome c556
MNKFVKVSLVAIAASILAASAGAQQLKPEDMIQTRQAGYKTMGWNMGKIKAQLEAGDKFDKKAVLSSAKVIQAIANSGMGALYAPGTDKAVGDVKTALKSEFFDPANKEELTKIAVNFMTQANKLAEVAEGGDAKAIQAQFGEMGNACKACHDKFKAKERH